MIESGSSHDLQPKEIVVPGQVINPSLEQVLGVRWSDLKRTHKLYFAVQSAPLL
jgi:hypothetical protein